MNYSMRTIVDMMNDNVDMNIRCLTKETYMDYGAGLKWKTIVVENIITKESYQALTPKQHEDIELGCFKLEQIQELIDTANELLGIKESH